jgi:putative membrane protein
MTTLPDRDTAVTNQTSDKLVLVGWAVIGLYGAWSFGLQRALASVLDPFTRNLLEQSLLTAFFLIHALGQWRVRELTAYAIVCFVISNLFENLSVMYGFPFGGFHHSEATGPRLFNIPWLATPTYMAMGYISWSVAQVLVGRTQPAHWRDRVWSAAVIAAFVFTMWDLSNDAVFHTINKAFFYDHPGPWFGVPMSNFAGWLLTTVLIYGAFGTWLAREATHDLTIRFIPGRVYWQQAIAMYAVVALGGIFRNLTGSAIEVTLPNGDMWQSSDIYAAMTLTTLFTMIFCALLAAVRAGDIPHHIEQPSIANGALVHEKHFEANGELQHHP